MESALALLDGDAQLLAQNVDGAIVGHLEVVDARHDRGKIVVGRVGWLAWLTDDGEHWSEVLEAWNLLVQDHSERREMTYLRLAASGYR